MVYESSYDSGRKPFQPDVTRGYWAAPGDFIYAGLSLGIRLDLLTISWVFAAEMGIYAIIPYLLCLAVYVVPLVVIHSFMGQFSSTGFISALRISPIFKSMGYIATAVNLTTLMYYSVMAAVPLLFLINSFRPTLPWSCEAYPEWIDKQTDESIHNICNLTEIEYERELDESSNETVFRSVAYHVPSMIFFGSHLGHPMVLTERGPIKFTLSWELVMCSLFIWAIIAVIFYKFFNTEKIGKMIRYGVWITAGLLLLFLIRVSFLHGSKHALLNYLHPGIFRFSDSVLSIPVFVLCAFGAGWGSMISLASFNKFQTNIMSHSWYICLGQMVIFIAFDLLTYLIGNHLSEILPTYDDDEYLSSHTDEIWVIFLSSGSVLASMEWPNMWCILFYFMLIVIALVFMVTHLYAMLTSVFDDFENLRENKMKVTLSVIGFLALCSIYSSSSHGIYYFSALPMDAIFTQTALNLLLILVVLWIYGRERFQRDIEFMLGRRFGTWRVNMLRFISPICLIVTLIFVIIIAFTEHYFSTMLLFIAAIIFILLPWLFVPIYAVIIMLQTTGTLRMRFKRCCRPSDWYPVEAEDRQRYEEAMGNLDITHQLNEITEDVPVS